MLAKFVILTLAAFGCGLLIPSSVIPTTSNTGEEQTPDSAAEPTFVVETSVVDGYEIAVIRDANGPRTQDGSKHVTSQPVSRRIEFADLQSPNVI